MNQLLLGASIPFLVGVLIYLCRGFRASFGMLVVMPFSMALGMIWAVAPDLPRLFGFYDLYMRLSLDPRCDIFFWHYSIDRIETDSRWYAVGFVLLFIAIIGAAWRELHLAEKGT